MTKQRKGFLVGVLCSSLLLNLLAGCASTPVKPSWNFSDFKEVEFDPFPGMNFQGKSYQLTKDELYGRVVWNLWSGDNGGFWNWLVQHGFGTADLLKMIESDRAQRFNTYGIINQPGYTRPAQADQYGLYIDVAKNASYDLDAKLDPAQIYTYGKSSGVMGLRLFPNPNFGKKGPAWDAAKWRTDPNYFNNPNLERPYVVGMSCSFCHIGPDPVNPPADPAEPEYANLSDYAGQHYFRVAEVFALDLRNDNFIKQLLMSNK
ncbi:MAG TPA: hypothetical protein VF698_04830, partial [Thermoanaerobaculia bacterium]